MRAKRTDLNQAQIAETLKKAGVSVFDLSGVGRGICDLIIGWRGKNYLVEVKNPQRKWRYTPAQEKFIQSWRGQRFTAETAEDILEHLGIYISPKAKERA